MPLGTLLGLVWETVRGQRLRAALTMLGIVVGVSSVVVLASIGEGTRQGLATQFNQFGTNLIGVTPGRTETFGLATGMAGGTEPLTIEDAQVLQRIPGVRAVVANAFGASRIEHERRGRDIYVYGMAGEAEEAFDWYARVGEFLPAGDPYHAPAVCVLGTTVTQELFPETSPIGKRVRIGDARFTVIGIMESKGQYLGFDLDDAVFIPAVRALRLFNERGVAEIDIAVHSHNEVDRVAEDVRRILTERHSGDEDFTMVTQQAMLEVVNDIMTVVTQGVVAIAAIAIFVGAMGILTITWVSVHERMAEIGLFKALGASNRQVLLLFLAESTLLSTVGGAVGVLVGIAMGQGLELAVPALRVELPLVIVPASLAVAVGVGIAAGIFPARRAASLDPVAALRGE